MQGGGVLVLLAAWLLEVPYLLELEGGGAFLLELVGFLGGGFFAARS